MSYENILDIQDPKLKDYECGICLGICQRPVRLSCCLQIYCYDCIKESLDIKSTCCICRRSNTIDDIIDNKIIQESIDMIPIKCNNYKDKCKYTGTMKEVVNHMLTCEFRIISCDLCLHSYIANNMNKHQTTTCINRKMECKYCKIFIQRNLIDKHLELDCLKISFECKNDCKFKGFREDIKLHDLVCPNKIVEEPTSKKNKLVKYTDVDLINSQVKQNPNCVWKYNNYHGGINSIGTIIKYSHTKYWVYVKWENNYTNTYSIGDMNNYDLIYN
jgi:hypothetical protein